MKAVATKSAPDSSAVKKQKAEARASSASQVSVQSVPVFTTPFIQRQCACGGDCPRCESEGKKKKRKPHLQTKLKIGTPGDLYEQEADRVAEQVMRMSAQPVPRKMEFTNTAPASVQRKCAACIEDEELVQRKEADGQQASDKNPQEASHKIDEMLISGGRALDALTRDFMESRFSYDFGGVRVHDDGAAAESARALNARAYTVGHDIFFGAGQYAPQSAEGKRLLAHELTHVIQQSPHGRAGQQTNISRVADGSAQALLQRQSEGESGKKEERKGDDEAAKEKKAADEKAALDGKDCANAPRGLGFQEPQPKCTMPPPRDIGLSGSHFHFCFDSDVLVAETPATVKAFAVKKLEQAPDMQFIVHGYSSLGGDDIYNKRLACHRANRMVRLLVDSGVPPAQIETASKGATNEFPGGPEFNRVVVVKAEIPPERRFGQSRDDPSCPKTPTNLGNVEPEPACPDNPRDLGAECRSLSAEQRAAECGSFNFCLDSDIFSSPKIPGKVMEFARRQPAASHFTVQGYASDEGSHTRPYNLRLSCHRAKRLARELVKVGVPPEQIDISGKGATTQFGDAEANRVGLVRVRPPVVGPTPAIERPRTPAEKHAVLDMAQARLNTGGYRLEADAYISFWTCGRVPTVRHAVNTTHWYVEGDDGVPKYKHFPLTTDPPSAGEAGGRLGLNAAVVSDDVFFDPFKEEAGKLTDVMAAMTYLSFFDKVSDEDFGTARERGSEREQGAFHLAELEGLAAKTPDPLKDKPAPKCQKIPPPTFKGSPAPGEVGATIPKFEVKEIDFLGGSGPSQLISPLPGNRGSLESAQDALRARAKVSLHGSPQEFRNYDVGFVLTATNDRTSISYRGGEQIEKGLPSPLRDTDGMLATEPWFSDGAFDSPRQGQVEVSMAKTFAEEFGLNFSPLSGKQEGAAGTPLARVARTAQYQLWLIARRRGAPLDQFSTHFLRGTQVDFQQNWNAMAQTPGGRFQIRFPLGNSDQRQVRFTGPVQQDLGAKETSTSNVISSCTRGFGKVDFELDSKEAKSSDGVLALRREDMPGLPQKVPGLTLLPKGPPVNYKPLVTMRIRDPKLDDRFEVGLIQNLIEVDWQNHYSSGDVVKSLCVRPLPLRDSARESDKTDSVFMTNEEPERAQLSTLRRQAKLQLRDVPGGSVMLNLADSPSCPRKKSGTLTRILSNSRFRTWVGIRFAKDNTCLNFLHHIDWKTTYEVKTNPDEVITAKLEVLSSGTTEKPTLEGLANQDCGVDLAATCK